MERRKIISEGIELKERNLETENIDLGKPNNLLDFHSLKNNKYDKNLFELHSQV